MTKKHDVFQYNLAGLGFGQDGVKDLNSKGQGRILVKSVDFSFIYKRLPQLSVDNRSQREKERQRRREINNQRWGLGFWS